MHTNSSLQPAVTSSILADSVSKESWQQLLPALLPNSKKVDNL